MLCWRNKNMTVFNDKPFYGLPPFKGLTKNAAPYTNS
jgi:hypothetical protein